MTTFKCRECQKDFEVYRGKKGYHSFCSEQHAYDWYMKHNWEEKAKELAEYYKGWEKKDGTPVIVVSK